MIVMTAEPNPFEPPAGRSDPVAREAAARLKPTSNGWRALGALLMLMTAGSAFLITAFFVAMLDWRPCGPAPMGLPEWAPPAAGGGAGLVVGLLVSWAWSWFGRVWSRSVSPPEVPLP